MELYGFMEREKKIPSYFFIITNVVYQSSSTFLLMVNKHQNQCLLIERISEIYCNFAIVSTEERFLLYMKTLSVDLKR